MQFRVFFEGGLTNFCIEGMVNCQIGGFWLLGVVIRWTRGVTIHGARQMQASLPVPCMWHRTQGGRDQLVYTPSFCFVECT